MIDSNYKMKKFVRRTFSFKGGGRAPTNQKVVDKRNCNLEEVPENLTKFKYKDLEVLLLDENHIQELPSSIFNLIELKRLSLSQNLIQGLPGDRLKDLKNLVELNVSSNQLTEIPENIIELEELEILDFSSNPIETLPEGIFRLCNLTNLKLNQMLLESLPEDFGSLSNLKNLDLRKNVFQSLPQSFSNLTQLEVLDLGENYFEHFPPQICSLQSLDELWLDENQIEILPPEISKLEDITFLDLSQNLLNSFPDEISHFTKLSNLYLSDNLISRLPEGIGSLSNLEILNLDKNKLIDLTPYIGNCAKLEEITLVENALRQLPNSIGMLSDLKCLNVDGNRLKCLPPEIGQLKNLAILSLRENELTSLPQELSSCCELSVLDVTGNILSSLPYSLTRLNLRGLWIAENQAKPMPCFQNDYDPGTGEATLTCFLLPQVKCQSLHQSKTKSDLSSNCKEEDFENNETVVQFQMSSQLSIERETTLVRQKTPHPKDLKAKAQKLFGNKSHEKQYPLKENSPRDPDHTDGEMNRGEIEDDVHVKKIESFEEINHYKISHADGIGNVCYDERISANRLASDEDSILSLNYRICNNIETLQLQNEDNKNLNLSQNSSQNLDDHFVENQLDVVVDKHETSFDDIKVLSINPLCISRQMTIVIELSDEKMGFSITGGVGNEYKSNDDGIFFSKIVPGGPAERAGLLANDKLLAVNGSSCANMEHNQVVEKLKIASKEGNSMAILIQREENKIFEQKNENSKDKYSIDSKEKYSTPLNYCIGSPAKSQVALNYLSPIGYMANRPSYIRGKESVNYTPKKIDYI